MWSLLLGLALAAQPRHALVVGANLGPRALTPLRYAEDDARRVAEVLTELGGFPADRVTVLYGPDVAEVQAALDRHATLARASDDDLFVFYYSGHADNGGLRLGEETLPYAQLRRAVRDMPADVRVGVLDACRSGEITRIKGVTVSSPFVVDRGLASEGEAWLTASSAEESAQESDTLRSSFFTHALLTGLRGAADRDDGVVSLDEAYAYAYDRTVARTGVTSGGTQHPAYDFQLKGRGDLPLTEVRRAEALLVLPEEMAGQLDVLRAPDNALVAEVSKPHGTSLTLGLPAGRYTLRLRDGQDVREARVGLSEGSTLSVRGLQPAEVAQASRKGEEPEEVVLSEPRPAGDRSRMLAGLDRQVMRVVERMDAGVDAIVEPIEGVVEGKRAPATSLTPTVLLVPALPDPYAEVAEEPGMPDGPVELRSEDGTLLAEGAIAGGRREGRWTFWGPGGERLAEGAYADGRKSGTWTWWDERGARLRRGTYEAGLEQGLWTEWYPNGNRRQRTGYARGVPNGRFVAWYENGARRREGAVRDGTPEGRWTFWHDNGQRAARGLLRGGRREGEWRTWHDNGALESEGDYRAGLKVGRWHTWHNNGEPASVGRYEDDRPEGRWRYFDEDGRRTKKVRYEAGVAR